MQQLLDSDRSGTHFRGSHFLGSTNHKEGKSPKKMATPPAVIPSVDGVDDKKDDSVPQNDNEEGPKPDKKRLESSKDASNEAEEPEAHSKLHPSTAPETDRSNSQEIPSVRRRKPRQTTYITTLFYISPLDTSHVMVIVGYIGVLLLSVGTRLYKLNEPSHVW